MIKTFFSYFKVGIINTSIHWISFFIFFHLFYSQSLSNLIAFFISMSISFILNAKYTFKKQITFKSYFLFAIFMACLSYFCGYMGDILKVNPIITLIAFSGLSLVIGFLYSKLVVFK